MSHIVVRTPEGYKDGAGDFPAPIATTMLDNATLDLVVGVQATDGMIRVDLNLAAAIPGGNTSYVVTIAASSTGIGTDVFRVASNVDLTTVRPTAVVVAGQLRVRLTGTGAGALVNVNFRITETLLR